MRRIPEPGTEGMCGAIDGMLQANVGRMPVPEFVLRLREKIGTDPLWLSGITAVITDEHGERLLLIRRSDTGEWAPVTGIIDPGEQPAVAAAREAREEADVVIRVERLAGINVTAPVVYPNGDRSQYLDVIFL
ncbi:MAG: NUDIX domain-containing protein, partial [Candidatus Dormibacter sp.]